MECPPTSTDTQVSHLTNRTVCGVLIVPSQLRNSTANEQFYGHGKAQGSWNSAANAGLGGCMSGRWFQTLTAIMQNDICCRIRLPLPQKLARKCC